MFFANNLSNIWQIWSNPNINHKLLAVLHHLKKKWTFFDEKWARNDYLLLNISNFYYFHFLAQCHCHHNHQNREGLKKVLFSSFRKRGGRQNSIFLTFWTHPWSQWSWSSSALTAGQSNQGIWTKIGQADNHPSQTRWWWSPITRKMMIITHYKLGATNAEAKILPDDYRKTSPQAKRHKLSLLFTIIDCLDLSLFNFHCYLTFITI